MASCVTPFSSHLQSFPASRSFPMSQFFSSGGQSIGALASVLSMNIRCWFPLGLTGCSSLQSEGLSRVFSKTSLKASILWHSAFLMVQLSHPHMTPGKSIALTRRTFVGKVMFLFFKGLIIAYFVFHLILKYHFTTLYSWQEGEIRSTSTLGSHELPITVIPFYRWGGWGASEAIWMLV